MLLAVFVGCLFAVVIGRLGIFLCFCRSSWRLLAVLVCHCCCFVVGHFLAALVNHFCCFVVLMTVLLAVLAQTFFWLSVSNTVGDKIEFPLCTDSPPTCERSCQQKTPKSRCKVASDFMRTLNVNKKVADLFLSGDKKVCARIQVQTQVASMRKRNKKKLQFCLLARVTS